jgi:glycosyltransferase involved in cell wall biosynthesis
MQQVKKRYLIDGRFLLSMKTGIDRYAYHITKELDKICKDCDITILVPNSTIVMPQYRNIKIVRIKIEKYWTQVVFGLYARIHKMIPINLCNEASTIAQNGIVCLHDVCYAETKEYYPYVTDFSAEEIEWFEKVYERIINKADKLITVSEFSKARIADVLKVNPEKITVIGNGWQHLKRVRVDEKLLNNYGNLTKGEYYYTLTSANHNKNVQWVIKAADRNPNETFVISGKGIDKVVDFNKHKNVVYTGYASDQLAKTLMKFCKAFIFPSYYEGFGIPPLEALSLGAKVIVSNTASLPEIFGNSAYYISPDNADIDLNELISKPVADADEVLSKYSWEKSAKQLLDILKE